MPETIMVPMRDGIRLATDVYLPDGAGPFPVILERTPYGRQETSRSEITAADPHAGVARRNRRVFHRAWLCRRLSGHPRSLRIRGRVRQVLVGRRGRLRHLRLAAGATLVRWPDLHHGPVLCGAHAGRAWLSESARSGGAGAGLRRLRQFLEVRHPPIRRVRNEAGVMGLSQCPGVARGDGGSGHAAALAGEDIRDWFTRMPWKPGHSPLRHHPDYEAYLFEQWTHGAFDGFWKQLGIWMEGYYDTLQPRRLCAHVVVVGSLHADGDVELSRPEAGGKGTATADPRALDAWRSQQFGVRRRVVRCRRRRWIIGPATGAPTGCGSSIM